MNEIWKPIEGFGGKYEVSSLSRVRNTKTGKTLKPIIWNTGYLIVRLFHEGKAHIKTLHRLVAVAFIPNPHNYPVVNHINENRADARIENLEWCTQSYNISEHHKINDPYYRTERVEFWKKRDMNIGGHIRFVKNQ